MSMDKNESFYIIEPENLNSVYVYHRKATFWRKEKITISLAAKDAPDGWHVTATEYSPWSQTVHTFKRWVEKGIGYFYCGRAANGDYYSRYSHKQYNEHF